MAAHKVVSMVPASFPGGDPMIASSKRPQRRDRDNGLGRKKENNTMPKWQQVLLRGTPTAEEQLEAANSPGADDNDDDDEAVEPDYPVGIYTLVIVKAFTAENAWVAWGTAILGVTMVSVEVICLMCIMYSKAWRVCVFQEDCDHGHVCEYIVGANKATCEDCGTLHGERSYALSVHTSTGAMVDTYQGDATTPEEYCELRLDYMEEHGLDKEEGFGDYSVCHSYHIFRMRDSTLDLLVRICTFIIVAGFVNLEKAQQCVTSELRWVLLRGREETHVGINAMCKFLEILLDKVLLNVVPAALIIMLVTEGISAEKTLVDGVTIAFILEIDDLALAVMANHHRVNVLRHTTRKLIKRLPDQLDFFHEACNNRGTIRGVGVAIYLLVAIELAAVGNCESMYFIIIELSMAVVFVVGFLEEFLAPVCERSGRTWLRIFAECCLGVGLLFGINAGVHHVFYDM